MIFQLIFSILFFCSQVIADDLYQYTDKSGNLVISNKSTNGSTKFELATTTRHKILREELEHEISALKQSQKLQTQSTAKEKLDLYSKDIDKHEKNINVLTKQLNDEG